MENVTFIGVASARLLGLAGIWPAAAAKQAERPGQGPVMKAHVINVGQANSTLPGAPGLRVGTQGRTLRVVLVRQVIELLREELVNALIATGCANVRDIDRSLVMLSR